MASTRWIPIAVTLILADASFATAAPTNNQAAQLVEHGFKEFHLGNWDAAIKAFEEAYRIDPNPNYLFDLAQAYRNKPDYDKAIFYFRSYLASKSNVSPKERNEIEGVVQKLDQQRAAQQESARTPPQGVRLPESQPASDTQRAMTMPADTTPPERHWYDKGWGWGFAGAGALFVGTAIGFFVAANSAEEELQTAPDTQKPSLQSTVDSRRTAGAIFAVAGGAALVTGIVIFAWPSHERHGKPMTTVSLGRGPAGAWSLVLQGRF